MGILTSNMQKFALQDLHRVYSSVDGWNIREEKIQSNDEMTVLLERMHEGAKETAKVLVSYNPVVTPDVLDDLKVSGVSGYGLPSRHEYAIIAPQNADVLQIPAGVRVYPMHSFAIDKGALVWKKRPVRKFAEVPVAAVRKATA
ncbi:MAG: hypothetical protein ABR999_02465 [Methanoregula sp.]|jgi:hypothetical protein|uniref:hypothetical protein n=1 Tax=Methanoregula sp. TaxID=2052170 RepID=UPI003D1071CA